MNLSLSTTRRGSAIAKIVGHNAARLPNFCDRVTMYVFEEMIEGKKLTEIINEQHENVKYLPGHKLPANVVRIWALWTGLIAELQSEIKLFVADKTNIWPPDQSRSWIEKE